MGREGTECDECVAGSGKWAGHRGRHKLSPLSERRQSAEPSGSNLDIDDFDDSADDTSRSSGDRTGGARRDEHFQAWSEEELTRLVSLVTHQPHQERLHTDWGKVAQQLGTGRTHNSVKAAYNDKIAKEARAKGNITRPVLGGAGGDTTGAGGGAAAGAAGGGAAGTGAADGAGQDSAAEPVARSDEEDEEVSQDLFPRSQDHTNAQSSSQDDFDPHMTQAHASLSSRCGMTLLTDFQCHY